MKSLTTTISDSVEILVFNFFFMEDEIGNHVTIESPPPECPLRFGCTTYDPSIYYFIIPVPLALSVRGN